MPIENGPQDSHILQAGHPSGSAGGAPVLIVDPGRVRIPRTAASRREKTYAQAILRVLPRPGGWKFAGPMFPCGTAINAAEFFAIPDLPRPAILLEYAGNDRTGRGHNRSNDIHVLWRWNEKTGDWDQIARVLSQGAEWIDYLAPIVRLELRAPARNYVEIAAAATKRVIAFLDAELDQLEEEGRERVTAMVYSQVAARFVSESQAA